MEFCVYYDNSTKQILEILPNELSEEIKKNIYLFWNQKISQEILLILSEIDKISISQIKSKIGHSMSTLHDIIDKLEKANLLKTEIIYEGKKQKIVISKGIFVNKNPRFISKIKTFFNRGIWVDKVKTNKIIDFLNENPDKYFTAEEISAKTKIPVDEITTLLSNWDSQITRAFSDFLKKPPFEKKVLYRGIKQNKKNIKEKIK